MNICILTRTTLTHSMGGMEQHVRMLSEGLVRNGHKVTVITTAHPGGVEQESVNGVKIHYLPGTTPGRYSHIYFKESCRKIVELHQKERFDIIHSQSGGGASVLKNKIHRELGVPFVVIMQGLSYNEFITRINILLTRGSLLEKGKSFALLFYFIYVALVRELRLLLRSDGVIATSVKQNKLIKSLYRLSDDRLFTVFNGVDIDASAIPDDIAALRRSLGITDEPVLLSVARLKKEKGVHVALNALPEIAKTYPKIKFVIVGDGEYRHELESLAKKLRVERNVIFTGTVPYTALHAYFSLAGVFINSTIRENGYDLTIVQAMGYAKPVVVTALKSLEGVIDDNQSGLLFPMGDSHELAERIISLLKLPDTARSIGQQAKAVFEEHFTADRMVQKTLDVYKAVIERAGQA